MATFNCHVCEFSEVASEKEFFVHINLHLKANETVPCLFKGCKFTANTFGTFKSHKNRKHNSYSYSNFKPGIVAVRHSLENASFSGENEYNEAGPALAILAP